MNASSISYHLTKQISDLESRIKEYPPLLSEQLTGLLKKSSEFLMTLISLMSYSFETLWKRESSDTSNTIGLRSARLVDHFANNLEKLVPKLAAIPVDIYYPYLKSDPLDPPQIMRKSLTDDLSSFFIPGESRQRAATYWKGGNEKDRDRILQEVRDLVGEDSISSSDDNAIDDEKLLKGLFMIEKEILDEVGKTQSFDNYVKENRSLSIRGKNDSFFHVKESPIAQFNNKITEIVISEDSQSVYLAVLRGKIVRYSIDYPELIASTNEGSYLFIIAIFSAGMVLDSEQNLWVFSQIKQSLLMLNNKLEIKWSTPIIGEL